MTNEKNNLPPIAITGNDNVVSVGQSGGQTARTIINQGPRYAVIGPDTIAQIKQGIPSGSTVRVFTAIQDAPTAHAANQFLELVKSLGYKLESPFVGAAMGYPYFKGVQLHDNKNGTFTLMIGDPKVD